MGKNIHVRCAELQSPQIYHVEHSPLKTTGSAGLAPVTSVTSSHSLPIMPPPHVATQTFQPIPPQHLCTCPSLCREPWPLASSFNSLQFKHHLLNDPACHCISTCNLIPSATPYHFPALLYSTDHFLSLFFLIFFAYC